MLGELTERIVRLVDGRAAFGFDVIFDLGDDGVILVRGSSQPIAVSNAKENADTKFKIKAADLRSMLTGELAPMMAYMQGKLKIDGDLSQAMQISSLFA